jgi:hypothetical protein
MVDNISRRDEPAESVFHDGNLLNWKQQRQMTSVSSFKWRAAIFQHARTLTEKMNNAMPVWLSPFANDSVGFWLDESENAKWRDGASCRVQKRLAAAGLFWQIKFMRCGGLRRLAF